MIRTNTTFILGAGASCPYAFPTAWGLYKKICSGACRTPPILDDELMRELVEKKFRDFRQELQYSGHQSIDAFLERRPDLEDTGKRAIACGLIPHEVERELVATESGPRWYRHLYAAINAPLGMFSENAVQFLTFNYDRSLEHFLTLALAATHKISREQAWGELEHIPIVHLYGSLGPYDPRSSEHRPYEPEITARRVEQCVASLKIVRDDNTEELKRAHKLLEETERVIFLGFSFDKVNVARLKLDRVKTQAHFSASAYGMTKLEGQRAQRKVGRHMAMGADHEGALRFLRAHVELDEE